MKSLKLTNGGLTIVGEISMALSMMSSAERLTINVALKKSGYSNSYPLWVYPAPNKNVVVQEISVAEKWDETVEARLLQGAKVLLFPSDESIQAKSVAGLFPPDFWNYGMFKGISEWAKKPVSPGTLGILTDPEHPIFNDFPTDPHTNWQWWSIIKASRPLELDQTSPAYRPIVQVIDNLERNHKFGLIFEFSVGKGSLLVCTARLKEILDRPEAYQLYQSMINYMQSDDFTPDYIVAPSLLKKLL